VAVKMDRQMFSDDNNILKTGNPIIGKIVFEFFGSFKIELV